MKSFEEKEIFFVETVKTYTSPVFNFISRFVDRNTAEDLTQETFLKVWKNLKKFDPRKASLKTWLFTIARNTTFDFLRKKKIINFSELEKISQNEQIIEEIIDEELLPDKSLEKVQNIETLNQALIKLNENYRSVLLLYYQEDLNLNEIAQVLNKPLNTVKSYHHRAILELRKILNN